MGLVAPQHVDLSGPGIDFVSPALAGRFLTTAPPGMSQKKPFKKNEFILFIYFWLHWVFVAARRFSLVAASRSYSSLLCTGFSLQWPLLLQSTGSGSCGGQAQ